MQFGPSFAAKIGSLKYEMGNTYINSGARAARITSDFPCNKI